MDWAAEHRTEQHKQHRRTYGTNTETTIPYAQVAGCMLQDFCPLFRCVAAEQGQLGRRQHLGGCDHSLDRPSIKDMARGFEDGFTELPALIRQANHRALPARNIGHWTLRDGRTDKIMAAGKGGFCTSY